MKGESLAGGDVAPRKLAVRPLLPAAPLTLGGHLPLELQPQAPVIEDSG